MPEILIKEPEEQEVTQKVAEEVVQEEVAEEVVQVSNGIYARYIKRPVDFLLSLTAVTVLSPILLILTIIGAIVMKGNPFFVQKRPGKIDLRTGKERIFKLIKFRTMTCEKDEDGNLLPDDLRLTSYGNFLRHTSLDELPELFNILKGDMSIVGERDIIVTTKKNIVFSRVVAANSVSL